MKIQIYGHRGASALCPENTMASFIKAYEDGADGVETDVHLTKDGYLVLCHDETIDRTSNGTGWIKDMTLQELRQYNYNFHHEGNYDIPLLEDLLKFMTTNDLLLNLEIKTDHIHYVGIEEKVLELVKQYQLEDRIIYSSFYLPSMLKIKRLNPKAYVAYLYEDHPFSKQHLAKLHGMNAIHPEFIFVDKKMVNYHHRHHMDVNVWTVNKKEDAIRMYECGVNDLIVNNPKEVRAFIEEHLKNK